jgi:hypothetical protein
MEVLFLMDLLMIGKIIIILLKILIFNHTLLTFTSINIVFIYSWQKKC